MIKKINFIIEAILNIFGFTQSNRRQNKVFKSEDITDTRLAKLKNNLDDKSIEIIDALIYLANNSHKKIYRSRDIALYSKFYNMTLLHKLFYQVMYKVPFSLKILQEVFQQKCGLSFVSNNELAKLKNKTSITAGAYWGDSSLVLNYITKGKVYGFEPNQHNIKLFQNLVDKNSKSGIIIPISKGLSDTTGISYISDDFVSTGSQLCDDKASGREIEIVSIDDFIQQHNIEDLGLIHLDIEGLETKVILGAKNTIRKFKPVLLISIYHNDEDFFDLKPMIESWNLGYNFKIRKLVRHKFELMLIATPKL